MNMPSSSSSSFPFLGFIPAGTSTGAAAAHEHAVVVVVVLSLFGLHPGGHLDRRRRRRRRLGLLRQVLFNVRDELLADPILLLPRVALRLLLEAELLLLIPLLLPRRLPLGPLLVLLVADHLLVREPLLALVVELVAQLADLVAVLVDLGAEPLALLEEGRHVRLLRLLLLHRRVHLAAEPLLRLLRRRELGRLRLQPRVEVVVVLLDPAQRLLRLVVLLDERDVRAQPLDVLHHLLVLLHRQRRRLLLVLERLDPPLDLLHREELELTLEAVGQVLLLLAHVVGRRDLVEDVPLLLLVPAALLLRRLELRLRRADLRVVRVRLAVVEAVLDLLEPRLQRGDLLVLLADLLL